MRTPTPPGAGKPVPIMIRLPEAMAQQLKEDAERNHRSLSAEASYRLEKYQRQQQEPAHV